MSAKKYNYLATRSVFPGVILVICVILSYIFPKFQGIYPLLSLFIAIYIGVIFANYNSYEQLINKLYSLLDAELKNAIAKSQIVTIKQFGEVFVRILSENCKGFGVDGIIFKTNYSEYNFSNREEITNNIPIGFYEKIEQLAQQSEDVKIIDKRFRDYAAGYKSMLVVPILFENIYMGYFALCSSHKRFNKMDTWLYSDVENLCIDDAFYSLKDREVKDAIIELERKLDCLTNRVAAGEIKDLSSFSKEAIRIITWELNCPAGYCDLRGSYVHYPDDLQLDTSMLSYIDSLAKEGENTKVLNANDPNLLNKLPYDNLIVTPVVFQKEYLGNFGILTNDKYIIDKVEAVLDTIEDSILDNYITMLIKGAGNSAFH